ncbi:hypothetical protein HCN44_002881 [Aphidius gifuensis]|uniref:Uncharacterized protein n=1 Tax=Aphidius gifuensis TaxID=684658 RepID=A0A835CNZ8_APHGI|nr:uncharacterized protein LOC122854279 [Aphidius gifuensis]KAF7991319.1 hypothetical protein HCN44_002881 [Aphidius gifuensis]
MDRELLSLEKNMVLIDQQKNDLESNILNVKDLQDQLTRQKKILAESIAIKDELVEIQDKVNKEKGNISAEECEEYKKLITSKIIIVLSERSLVFMGLPQEILNDDLHDQVLYLVCVALGETEKLIKDLNNNVAVFELGLADKKHQLEIQKLKVLKLISDGSFLLKQFTQKMNNWVNEVRAAIDRPIQ